ncbi:MAG: tetratricopeptide repeat protein [Nitrospirae bacterium]|nr:tetratricopeptide repeat protein [Nitrospirota bacterium]MBF0591297.1 tetratricopeptide repeat protein [Nitrospirota bacterium]
MKKKNDLQLTQKGGQGVVKISDRSLQSLGAALLDKTLFHVLTVVAAGFLAYSNMFNVPFVFDDLQLYDSILVTDLWSSLAREDILNLTFFLNYKLHGFNVVGYHIVNLIIHIINAIFIYLLVIYLSKAQHHLFNKPDSADTGFKRKSAFFIALLFVTHPLQIQAVTLTIQRRTALVTLFYLLTIILYLKWRFLIVERNKNPSPVQNTTNNIYQVKIRPYSLCLFAFISAFIASKIKQTAITLPVIITIIEFMFFSGPPLKRLLRCIPFYLIVITPFKPYAYQVVASSNAYNDVTMEQLTTGQMTAEPFMLDLWQNLFTQFRVIITYIRMLFFPVNLTLIYDYPAYMSFWIPAVYISFSVLSSIFVLGLYLCYRALKDRDIKNKEIHLISFGILWFFINIAPQSSIIPLGNWLILEYRVYLASVGFFVILIATLFKIINAIGSKRAEVIFTALIFTIALIHTAATYNRNTLWQSAVSLFEDNIKKSPVNVQAHYSLGYAYMEAGRNEEAMREFQTIIASYPNHPYAHSNIGYIYETQGMLNEAIREYQTAIKLKPYIAEAHNNIGNIWYKTGKYEEAMKEYKLAINFKPTYAEAHNGIGSIYGMFGHNEEALKEFETALKFKPEDPDIKRNIETLKSITSGQK